MVALQTLHDVAIDTNLGAANKPLAPHRTGTHEADSRCSHLSRPMYAKHRTAKAALSQRSARLAFHRANTTTVLS
jgi:hypothetical protein